jgi:hypothetical protein
MGFESRVWCTPNWHLISVWVSASRDEITCVHTPTRRHRQCSPRTPLHLRRPTPRIPLPYRPLPIPTIPHLDHPIHPRRCHIPSRTAWIHTHTAHRADVREEAHGRGGHVGRPERGRPVLMAQIDDGVVHVLGHGLDGAELSAVFDDELAGGGVLVF